MLENEFQVDLGLRGIDFYPPAPSVLGMGLPLSSQDQKGLCQEGAV